MYSTANSTLQNNDLAQWIGGLMANWPVWAIPVGVIILLGGWIALLFYNHSPNRKSEYLEKQRRMLRGKK